MFKEIKNYLNFKKETKETALREEFIKKAMEIYEEMVKNGEVDDITGFTDYKKSDDFDSRGRNIWSKVLHKMQEINFNFNSGEDSGFSSAQRFDSLKDDFLDKLDARWSNKNTP